jgi:hypothetical protein
LKVKIEYFHHYNVKRIRPIALGPFDYERENRTNMLWVAEGLTVYYEYKMVHSAALMSNEAYLKNFQNNIAAYEKSPGHLYQTLAQADGPFGRTGDSINKTIPYYEKGPAVGLLLDMAIRHATANQRSLDDVMRRLYREFYQQKNGALQTMNSVRFAKVSPASRYPKYSIMFSQSKSRTMPNTWDMAEWGSTRTRTASILCRRPTKPNWRSAKAGWENKPAPPGTPYFVLL